MKNSKYNYNKTAHAFFDSINQQQTKFYANNIMPMAQQQQQMPSKRGGTNIFIGNENMYYTSGIDANNLNGCHYYEHAQQHINSNGMGPTNHNLASGGGRQRYAPYSYPKRSYDHTLPPVKQSRFYNYAQPNLVNVSELQSPSDSTLSSSNVQTPVSSLNVSISNIMSSSGSSNDSPPFDGNGKQCVTLQISNLDTTIEENDLKQLLLNRLKPIASVISICFENISVAKIKLPSDHQARQVIAFLHRKKIGHKRIMVSYTRESSTLDSSTLRCQVAGLLKDIPNYKLSMYKFRELFQSRFKTSISVIDLHDMKDICTIIGNKNEELIALRTELIDSIESSELMECFQQSVPYCAQHFVKMHRGWAEQEIDPLPNVQMTVGQVRDIVYALLKNHKGIVPIASIVHCIQADLNVMLEHNENGVNFEHLISCVQGVQITSNKFSIKILNWSNGNEMSPKDKQDSLMDDIAPNRYMKYGNMPDAFAQISREIIELIKLSPKATLKFSRFIPAYHNHFGKQCRVADYGYTKLIDLFEALPSVVQVMGEGENRQITLTHRIQMQRFKTDLLRILRTQSSKSLQLSHIPMFYEQVQCRKFNITDYGVCDINDILECLVNTNVVVINNIPCLMDTMISIPKRKQSATEVEKTSNFAVEVVELFKLASQYTILFEKFACSYHYHFGYQCRLSDYGFLKLADLMESITGVVEMELSNEEDRKIYLSPNIAQRIFSEQLKELIEQHTGSSETVANLHEILIYHKKKYGYQILPQSLGFHDMLACIESLPYVEVIPSNGHVNIICHHDDQCFRNKCYAAVRLLLDGDHQEMPLSDFIIMFNDKYSENLNERIVKVMKHAIEMRYVNDTKYITVTNQMCFVAHMVKVIEMQGTMKIQDLSNSLNISFKAFFPLGYPNLTTFLQAYADIFVLQLSKTNAALNEVSVSRTCILSESGCVRMANNYFSDNNNKNHNNSIINVQNNNNDSTAINYNEKFASTVNGSFEKELHGLSIFNNEQMIGGATSKALQASLQCLTSATASTSASSSSPPPSLSSSMSAGSMGGQKWGTRQTFDGIDAASSLNNSTQSDLDAPFALNSTIIGLQESFESSSNASTQNAFEMHLNMPSIIANYNGMMEHRENDKDAQRPNQMQIGFNYRDGEFNENKENSSILGNGHEMSCNRKRKIIGEPPKPDTPPTTPYWNNPIWSSNIISPPSIKIEIPKLEVMNSSLTLDSPMAMARIAKNNKFVYQIQNE